MLSGYIVSHGQRSPQEMDLCCPKRLLLWSAVLMVLLWIPCWDESGYPQNMDAILAWGVMCSIHVWLPARMLCRNDPLSGITFPNCERGPIQWALWLWGSSAPSTPLFSNAVGCGQCCVHYPVKCLVLRQFKHNFSSTLDEKDTHCHL